jgi:short-subunit dehydrogenase
MKIERGQVAIVTGASRGLGVYIARVLATRGVNLVLAARTTEALSSLAAEITAKGVKAIPVQADMAVESDVRELYRTAMQTFGQVDYVVNNAGIELVNYYESLSAEDIQRAVNVNLVGPMLLSHLALQDMIRKNNGHIINIASAAGLFPPPYSETYSATKAGLIAFTQSLRTSAALSGYNIGASVIAPGYMDDTGMYEEMKAHAPKAPWFIGSLPAKDLADEVIRSIERNKPIKILMPGVPTFLKLLHIIMPRTFQRISIGLGIFDPLIGTARYRASLTGE